MKIKKVKDIKTEVQDPVFNAKSLVRDKDEKPSFKTSTDDQEKVDVIQPVTRVNKTAKQPFTRGNTGDDSGRNRRARTSQIRVSNVT